MLQLHGIFTSDMKKQVSTKQLLQALLHTFIETNDLGNIYNGDGTHLMTLDEATKFVDGLDPATGDDYRWPMKEEASPEQVAFESSLDNMMEEFRNVFPPSISEAERGAGQGTWFDLMHSIWNKHVQVELMKKYSNL